MKIIINDIINAFIRYTGDGWGIWAAVLVSLIIIAVKDRYSRNKLVWPAVLVLFIFFNPLFYKIVGINFMRGVYWRLLWVLPIPIILAAGGVCLYSLANKKVIKIICVLLFFVVFLLVGKNIYTKENFNKPTNKYQLPQYVIDVANVILEDEDYDVKKVIVPNEMLSYIRQYTSDINLFYGRNAYGYISPIGRDEAYMHKMMSTPDIDDPDMISRMSYTKGCNYIVFSSVNHKNYKEITQYGYYEYYKSVDGYDIYRRIVNLEQGY